MEDMHQKACAGKSRMKLNELLYLLDISLGLSKGWAKQQGLPYFIIGIV